MNRPHAPRLEALMRSLILLASLGLLGLTSACSTAGMKSAKPTVSLEEIRVAKFDQDGLDLTITLKVSNPSEREISLEDLKAEVLLQDVVVAEARSSQSTFMLRAERTVQLPMKGRILFKPLGQTLKATPLALVSGGVDVVVRGSATSGYGLIPLSFERRMRLEPLNR